MLRESSTHDPIAEMSADTLESLEKAFGGTVEQKATPLEKELAVEKLSQATLESQMENRGSPIMIEITKELPASHVHKIITVLADPEKGAFGIDFEAVKTALPITLEKVKDLSALRLIQEVQDTKRTLRKKELKMSDTAISETSGLRQAGYEPGFDETGPLMGINEKIRHIEDTFEGTREALAILELTLNNLSDVLKANEVPAEVIAEFKDLMENGIAKAGSDKIIRLSGKIGDTKRKVQPDTDLREMLELAEQAVEVGDLIPDKETAAKLRPEASEKQKDALQKIEGQVMLKMLGCFSQLSKKLPEAAKSNYQFGERTADLARSMTGHYKNPELMQVAMEEYAGDYLLVKGGAPKPDFHFEVGQNELHTVAIGTHTENGQVGVTSLSADVFRDTLVRTIQQNVEYTTQLRDDEGFRKRFVRGATSEITPNTNRLEKEKRVLRNIEGAIDVFQTITLNWNDVAEKIERPQDRMDPEIPIRIMAAITTKQFGRLSSENFDMAVNAPLNAHISERTDFKRPERDPNATFAESINVLSEVLDDGIRNKKFGEKDFREQISAAYIYAAKALKTADAYTDALNSNSTRYLKANHPVAILTNAEIV